MKGYRITISKVSFITLFLILETYVFSLKIVGQGFYSINSNQQGILATITVVFTIATFCRRDSFYVKTFKNSIILFFLIYFIEFGYSFFKYGQGVENIFVASNHYIIMLVYFALTSYFQKHGIEDFNRTVVKISIINMGLHFLQYILYRYGVKFLFFNEENLRMGNLRLSHAICSVSVLGVIIAFAELLTSNKNKKRNIFTVGLGIISFVYVARARFAIIGAFIIIVLMLARKNRKNAAKILFGGTAILIIIIMVLNYTLIGKMFIESFIIEDTGSYRLREIEYYLNQVKEHPVLGMGFIRMMGFTPETQLLTGPRFHYSRTDVGIFGFINTFGLLGLLWYLVVFFKMTRTVIKAKRQQIPNTISLIIFGVYIWNIVYMPTMMLFGVYSIFVQAVLMAYIDYYIASNEFL